MTRRSLVGLIGLVLAPLVAGCGDSPTAPSVGVPFSQSDLVVGTGEEAVNGRTVRVHYTLWLYDPGQPDNKGAQLESTIGRDPFSFVLGARQVIEGWDRGVAGMRVGGRRRLVVPASLAYGAARNGIIPPNATLLFEIELIEVSAATS